MPADALSVEKFSTSLIALIESYTTEASRSVTPSPDRVIAVQPGQAAAWDGNCDGQLWTRLVGFEPSPSATPARRHGADLCAVPVWVVTLELGIIRCAAQMDNRGKPPSGERIAEDGHQSIDDLSALLGVLQCHPRTRSVSSWTPRGPEGGFHGGYWTFTVEMSNCITCEMEA